MCVDLGASYLRKATPRRDVPCITTSNIDNLLILPTKDNANVEGEPVGMVNNVAAEVLLVLSKLAMKHMTWMSICTGRCP